MAAGAFGFVLLTEWGGAAFEPHSELIGVLAIFAGFLCVLLGFSVNSISRPDTSTEEQPVNDADREVNDPPAPLCPSCLAPAKRLQHFCAECGAPLTSHAEIDPLGRIYSMGDTFRKAAASPRRRIVLIGMWFIFALPLVFVVMGLVSVLGEQGDVAMPGDGELVDWSEVTRVPAPWTLSRIFCLLLLIGVALLYGAIVFKTTRNYFRKSQTSDSDAADVESNLNTEADS